MKALITLLLEKCTSRKRFSSNDYWCQRYNSGGTSGRGSYGRLADFKAEVMNSFVCRNGVTSVIEFGCGDGNQLTLAEYPTYTGYDVSMTAVTACRARFRGDASKQFFHTEEYAGQKAQLTTSLDVIYHLIENDIFDEYMRRLFDASSRFVAIYSSNQDSPIEPVADHVRHRKFSNWVDRNAAHWKLSNHTPNLYPYNGDSTETSFSDFYFYEKA